MIYQKGYRTINTDEGKVAFLLETRNTSYIFGVNATGQLEHMYYGKKIRVENFEFLLEKHEHCGGNLNSYSKERPEVNLEDVSLEISGVGKGDIRDPFVEITYPDGSTTTDFIYISAENDDARADMNGLPYAYNENGRYEHLKITMRDMVGKIEMILHYNVYPDCDVITRSAEIINLSDEPVRINRLMSAQLDFGYGEFDFTSFHGAWAREMNKSTIPLNGGRVVVSSFTGSSSSRSNPFTMLSEKNATEDIGNVYAFNLIYSGNHYTSAEYTGLGHTRILTGINPMNFSWILDREESFMSPEAVMAFSDKGFTGISHVMHTFVREHIVRGHWKRKARPILINSWEACYFDISEKKLLEIAKVAAECGIELFVMDDGWFGERNSDKSSLGDWVVNKKKLPHGLSGLAKKINDLGMSFGIWVEPEMVSEDSDLYRFHPEWALKIPGRDHTEGRNQMILDLCNKQVRDYIVQSMSDIFASANISYVKWDMNRIFSDYFSPSLKSKKQAEFAHRYMLGLYEILTRITKAFPDILFEGCAAGGNRFDLGMLSFFPQIWASDDTDAVARATIQTGYSYGYPMSVVSAHVSDSPNHQTLRRTDIETRFAVASMGLLGYECNLADMPDSSLDEIKKQVLIYKLWRNIFFMGDIYRQSHDGLHVWTIVRKDKKKAVGIVMNTQVEPNRSQLTYKAKGLADNFRYKFYNVGRKYNIREFGSLINTVAPIHIREDSALYKTLAKRIKMDSEVMDCIVYGDALMNAGVKLYQAYVGTGYNDKTRYFGDYAVRMYFMEEASPDDIEAMENVDDKLNVFEETNIEKETEDGN